MAPESRFEPPQTVVVAGSSHVPWKRSAAVLVLLALAILKPWGDDTGVSHPPPPARTAGPPVAVPSPTPDLSAEGLAEPICLGTGAWLVASIEQWRTHPVRVWKVIEPIDDATGPTDPLIPSVPVVAYTVPALGWCAPAWGPGRPVGPVNVTAWRVVDGLAESIELRQVLPALLKTPLGALYGPRTQCGAGCPSPAPGASPIPETWLLGRYVFRYEDEGRPEVLWFAADLEQLPPLVEPPPAPFPAFD